MSFAAFSDKAISATSPALWLKADAITSLVDGDPVGTWADSSGNGRDATQATAGSKPTYKTAIQNGLPVVRFDGTSDFLTSSASASASGQTVIAVVNASAYANNAIRAAAGGTNGNGGLECRLEADGSAGMVQQNTAAIATSTNVLPTTGAWHIVVYTMTSGTSYAFRIDGIPAGSGTTALTISASLTTSIGRNPAGTEWFHGDMAEVASWDRVLTGTEINDIESKLRAKWGTAQAPITGATWTASTEFSSSWLASLLADGKLGGSGLSWSASSPPAGWVKAQLASSAVVVKYVVVARTDAPTSAPAAWTFEGSNDPTFATLTTLDTRSSQTFSGGEAKTYTFSNSTAYAYYRLNISATGAGGATWPSFSELTLYQPVRTPPTVSSTYWTHHAGILDGTVYGTSGNLPGVMLGADGAHPNDRGMTYLADSYEYALSQSGLTPATGAALTAYGDSWTASDTQNTAGMRAVHQLRDRLSASLTNRAVNGYKAGDVAAAAIGTSGTFTAGTGGLVLVAGVGLEDLTATDTAQQRLATENHLRALFVALNAAERIEQGSFTLTSYSSSSTSDSTSSGGNHAVTSTEGATATYTLTKPGRYYLLTKGTDGTTVVGGKLTITYAGIATVQDLNAQHVDTGNLLTAGIGPLAIPLGTLGTGTLTVTYSKNGRSGTVNGYLDALVRISDTPPTILAVKPVPVTAAGYSVNSASGMWAVLNNITSVYDAMFREYPGLMGEWTFSNWYMP